MNRRRKLGAVALVVVALASFSLPFLLRAPGPSHGGGGGGGGNGHGGQAGGPPTAATGPQPTNPAVAWKGWHGICNGEGKHLGILKKAASLGFNLTLAPCLESK